jgi:PAS domain-containing protein
MPAGVRASLTLGQVARWQADLRSLGFPALPGAGPPGALLVPIRVRGVTQGLVVATGQHDVLADAEAALSVLAGQVGLALDGLGTARWVRTVVERSGDLVLVLERDATIRLANATVERVLGWDPQTLAGAPLVELLHPDDAETVPASWVISSRVGPTSVNASSAFPAPMEHRPTSKAPSSASSTPPRSAASC